VAPVPGADLAGYDRRLRADGIELLAGVDEAGRGPLAGPVVAAAVILMPGADPPGVADSKTLSARQRERAFIGILEQAEAAGLGIVDRERIDRVNILEATLEAMSFALCGLRTRPGLILIDGNRVPGTLPGKLAGIPVRPLVGGDGRSLAVAAASIIAKCVRDSIMRGYDLAYPGYGFAAHKGYGTRAHLDALRRLGPCPVHRRSFAPVRGPVQSRSLAGQRADRER
jgi:ribonuclease HII